MPLKPIDYSKTIFYRIVCNDLNIKDCYVGHTTNFIKRKQCHKNCCNDENNKSYNLKVYQYIREHNGWNNWSMIMIEQISCENHNEACKLERKFIEEYNATLNMLIPTRTQKEWNEVNKDKIKEWHKNYKENNKNKIKEYNKEYNEKNKNNMKEYNKEYYKQNKDKIYDKIKEYSREKITCECGIILCRDSLSKHKKRFIH
jgi:hypothetical protein